MMIKFEDMPLERWESMCVPMNLVLSADPRTGFGALYIGSWFASVDSDLLNDHRIRNLVEVHDGGWGGESTAERELYKVPIQDASTADLKSHLDGVCQHIHDRLAAGRNTLVHCQQGISRSSAVVIAYLIQWHNMSFDSALSLVKKSRACAKPNSGFEKTLREWEQNRRRGGRTGNGVSGQRGN